MLAGSDELVKADRMMCRFVAEAIQASKKALFATAAKETVAIQDQGLSLVGNAFSDLSRVADVQRRRRPRLCRNCSRARNILTAYSS